MNVKLTAEQRTAMSNHVGPLPMTLEKLQREADHAAIREGIADMEAGRVLTLEELDKRIRRKLGLAANNGKT